MAHFQSEPEQILVLWDIQTLKQGEGTPVLRSRSPAGLPTIPASAVKSEARLQVQTFKADCVHSVSYSKFTRLCWHKLNIKSCICSTVSGSPSRRTP